MKREYEAPKYEHPVDDINWTKGVGQPAGVYWLRDRTVIAAHDSAAEARLISAGATLVATLRFDPDPVDTVQRGRTVERLEPARAVRALLVSGEN